MTLGREAADAQFQGTKARLFSWYEEAGASWSALPQVGAERIPVLRDGVDISKEYALAVSLSCCKL
jgi:hypothetical protein